MHLKWMDQMKATFGLGLEGQLDREIKLIHRYAEDVKSLSDDDLRESFLRLSQYFSDKIEQAYLPIAFAHISEAIQRVRGWAAYDVQLRAGLVLARGKIAEMATGEGKTLVAVFPAAVFALTGRGVHLATVNAYLAERDYDLMSPIYHMLGLTVGLLKDKASPDVKRKSYQADITYGTGYEFGFDYLRDQIARIQLEHQPLGSTFRQAITAGESRARPLYQPIQRALAYAIIDEADSVLIDEAITPLVLSKGAASGENPGSAIYRAAHVMTRRMEEGEDFIIDMSRKRVKLTDAGLKVAYLQRPDDHIKHFKRAWHEYLEQSLRANYFYKKNIHYLVRGGAIELIDENTGRSFSERRWQGGLHQAIEAKEKLEITHETESDVTVSRQRFYQLYPLVCGMTGTAWESRRELKSTYGLPVIVIPRNRRKQVTTFPPRIFSDRESKHHAIAEAVRAALRQGRPVLIGTRNVRQSEALASILNAKGIRATRLNAKQDAEEAAIIARAGQMGRVTLATNMAGRGADIPLGEGIEALGGLYVIIEERNDSRRVDRQLAGRAGRQGASGAVQYFMSIEDEHFRQSGFVAPPGLTGEIYTNDYIEMADKLQLEVERMHAKIRNELTRKDRMLDRLRKHT